MVTLDNFISLLQVPPFLQSSKVRKSLFRVVRRITQKRSRAGGLNPQSMEPQEVVAGKKVFVFASKPVSEKLREIPYREMSHGSNSLLPQK